jgi:hypothetical protein
MPFILVIPIAGFFVVLVVAFRLFIVVMLIVTFAVTIVLTQSDRGIYAHERQPKSAGN